MIEAYTVSQAQAHLPKLVKRDAFAITHRGQIVGVYLSRDRIEALMETMELLGESDFTRTLKDFESGRMKFQDIEDVEKELNGNARLRRKTR